MGLFQQINQLFTRQPSALFSNPDLGNLVWTRNAWRTGIVFDGVDIALVLAGGKAGLVPQALAIARTLRARYATWRPEIERALFEHYGAYTEAAKHGLLRPHAEQLVGRYSERKQDDKPLNLATDLSTIAVKQSA